MPTTLKKVPPEALFSKLGLIESESARRKFLSRHKSLARIEVVNQLSDLVLEKIRVDTRQALHLADAALLIARKLRRKEALAAGLRTKANALYASGQNRAAVEHHEEATKIYETIGDQKDAARTLSASIQPLILLGEYDRAFAASERAREIFTKLGEGAIVFPQQNERLDRSAQRAGSVFLVSNCFVDFGGFFVMLDCRTVLARGV